MSSRIPFSAAEDAIVLSERRRWPMNILIEIEVAGVVDEQRLLVAVREAVARLPSAGYRRAPRSWLGRHQTWEETSGFDIHPIQMGVSVEDLISQPLPLDAAPPFRLALNPTEFGGTQLALCAHHGAFDGLGAMQFLREIASCYADRARQPPESGDPGPGEVGPDEVASPSDVGLMGAMGAVRHLLRSPTSARMSGDPRRAGRKRAPDVDPYRDRRASGYGLTHRLVEASSLSALQRGLGGRATVNDALVSTLHLSAGQWIEASGGEERSISVAVPMSGRSRSTISPSVGNAAGQTTTWSDLVARRDPAELLRLVHEQMRQAKGRGISDTNVAALGMTGWLPVRIRAALPRVVSVITRDRSLATIRLSNLGLLDRSSLDAAPFDVRSIWFSPPCRPPQALALGVSTFNGQLGLTARWCRPAWDRESTERFLDLFCANLDRLAELG